MKGCQQSRVSPHKVGLLAVPQVGRTACQSTTAQRVVLLPPHPCLFLAVTSYSITAQLAVWVWLNLLPRNGRPQRTSSSLSFCCVLPCCVGSTGSLRAAPVLNICSSASFQLISGHEGQFLLCMPHCSKHTDRCKSCMHML